MIRIAQPQIGPEEREAVLAVLDSGQLVAGPVTQSLEHEFAAKVSGTQHAVAVGNGTAALHVALLAHDIGPGDEVITTPFSFQATANMILATGARPVFVDIGDDGNIDASQVEQAITPRTRAVLPVYLYGKLCDIESIEAICRARGLALIEDAAQAHGASRGGERAAGSFGAGCFSFYATKNMTAGEGGIITTNDGDLAAKMRLLRSHGETARYSSSILGFNYRITEMGAALALAQLRRLVQFNENRRANAAYLSANLHGVVIPDDPGDGSHVWHQYTIRVPEGRDSLISALTAKGIQTSIYYPTLIPDQPLYRARGFSGEDCPNARRISQEVLSLPVHPGLSPADLDRVVSAVNNWAASRGGTS